MRQITISAWPQHEVPDVIERQVIALEASAWPSDSIPRWPRHDVELAPITMVAESEGVVVAALSILSKTISHAGHDYRAAGLSAVLTAPEARGEGLGLALIRAARQQIVDAGADLSIFTCDPELCEFYARGGWRVQREFHLLGGTRSEPLASKALGKVTMLELHSDSARSHEADFVEGELELYPGAIDKLW